LKDRRLVLLQRSGFVKNCVWVMEEAIAAPCRKMADYRGDPRFIADRRRR
jgi:hypothetical protein